MRRINKMRNGFKFMLAGILGLAGTALPLRADGVKMHGELDLAYVPLRQYGLDFYNEFMGRADLNLGLSPLKNLELTVGGGLTSYLGVMGTNYDANATNMNAVPGLDALQYTLYAKTDWKNYELYASYSSSEMNIQTENGIDIHPENTALTGNTALQFGLKIKLGNEEEKSGFSINPTATLDTSYVPSREQVGTSNTNEIKTEFTGNVEIKYDDFFFNIGGMYGSYDSSFGIVDGLPSFYPDLQEYTFFSSLGGKSQSLHSDIGIYFFHECDHPISYLKKDLTIVGNNVYSLDTPLYVFDSGNLFFINQASSTEIGASFKF